MRRHWRDVLLVLSAWVVLAFVIRAQPWTSLDTPDSEFAASMTVFGHDVTDRVPTPVYYWTRLGSIAPGHALTSVLGPMTGLAVFRLVLLAIITAATYVLARRISGRLTALLVTVMVGSNTVVLTYLGNPYPTATAVTCLVVLVLIGTARPGWLAGLGAGATLGWLVMTSPYAALLGAVLYLVTLLAWNGRSLAAAPAAQTVVGLLVGTIVGFGGLWIAGRVMFPELDWLSTYQFWNSALNQADYISDRFRWAHDPSMLVPAMAVLVGLGTFARARSTPAARVAAVLPTAAVVFSLAYWWLKPNNYLEIPHYQAMLWAPALLGMALAVCVRLPDATVNWPRGLAAGAAFAVVVAAGHSTVGLDLWPARALALVAAMAFVLVSGRWWLVLGATTLVFATSQVLQNARDSFGVSTTRLYANAYLPNEAELMMRSAIRAEEWVVANTQPGERVLPWVDAQWPPGEQRLLPLAAFQLWGANEAEHGPVVTEDTVRRWQSGKPTSIVMYGTSLDTVLRFWNGIPKANRPTVPECIDVAWPDPPTAKVCLTHLTW